MQRNSIPVLGAVGAVLALGLPAAAQTIRAAHPDAATLASALALTNEPSMLDTTGASTGAGWVATPLFTVGETFGSYQPVGILDGIGIFDPTGPFAQALVNHELGAGNGYAYTLANGTQLTGARVTKFNIFRDVDPATGSVEVGLRRARLAYDTVYDRQGNEVVDPAQINETGNAIDGFARFCGSMSVQAGTYGFVDDIYFCGEENGKPFAPHGGTEWAIDVDDEAIWAVPALGRMAWENLTPIDSGDADTVAVICGDDSAPAPLYLYVGRKNALGDGSFLDRNGLAVGDLYAWVADSGDTSPQGWNGFGAIRTGTFQALTVLDAAQAGNAGYDPFGFADIDTLQNEAFGLGAFQFSRPEDVGTNPLDGAQVALASTGRGQLFPADNWGTLYVFDVDAVALTGLGIVLHDADALAVPDEGVRSPDNLEWARDGKLYVQEDRSTSPGSLFGAATGIDASIWSVDPVTQQIERIAVVDRSVVVPAGSTDSGAGDLGNWETSGVIDVTDFFETLPGERLLLVDVEAHGIQDGPIGGNPLLDEGGQLLFLSKQQ